MKSQVETEPHAQIYIYGKFTALWEQKPYHSEVLRITAKEDLVQDKWL